MYIFVYHLSIYVNHPHLFNLKCYHNLGYTCSLWRGFKIWTLRGMYHSLAPEQPNRTEKRMTVVSQHSCIWDVGKSPGSVLLLKGIPIPSNIAGSLRNLVLILCCFAPCAITQPVQNECKTPQAPVWRLLQCRYISSFHQRYWPNFWFGSFALEKYMYSQQ